MVRVRICGVLVLAVLWAGPAGPARALDLGDVMSSGKDAAKKLLDKKEADDAKKKKEADAKRKKAEPQPAQTQKDDKPAAPQTAQDKPAPAAKPAATPPAAAAPAASAAKPPEVAAGPKVPGGFAYLLGNGDGKGHAGSLWVYAVNKGSGMLEEVAGTPLYAKNSIRLYAVPGGKILYGFQEHRPLTGFLIDPSTGLPTEVTSAVFNLGDDLEAIALDPDGSVLYVAIGQRESEAGDAKGHMAAFAIDKASGAIREMPGSRSKLAHAQSMVVAPSGKFAYMVDGISNEPMIHTFAIDPKTRAFKEAPKSMVTGGIVPEMLRIRPDGSFLYAIDSRRAVEGEANILVYRIDAATGALSDVPGSPFEVGHGACYLTTDAQGKFVFVANCGSSTAAVFKVDPTSGALTQVPGSPFRGGTGPVSLAPESSGNYLYVPNDSSRDMSIWVINPGSGVLTSLSKYPFKWDRAFHEIVMRP